MSTSKEDYILLMLADSALPVGGFVASSGLESASKIGLVESVPELKGYIDTSLENLYASTFPCCRSLLNQLANAQSIQSRVEIFTRMSREYDSFNVSTPTLLPQRCNAVAQNASLAQGAAIIALFSRLLDTPHDTAFLAELKRRARTREIPLHNTLCFAVVCHLVKVKREKAAHLLLFNHARSVVSAAIRLNLLGPYEAQSVLLDLHGKVSELSEREVDVDGDVEYYQTNPIQDIVTGKHNQQYSRLFNS